MDMGRDVSVGGCAARVPEFVDGSSGAVYVSEPAMRVPLASVLSRAISRALGLPLVLQVSLRL